MQSQFSNVAPLIIKAEGDKDVDEVDDQGGQTKYGISQSAYPNLDIANLTEPEALVILEKDYWNKYKVSQIVNQAIANQVFFMLVNMGEDHAIRIVQVSINACGRGIIRVAVDGVMGPSTILALNSISDNWLSNRIRLEAIRYYLQVTDANNSQVKFFRGWVRRALNQ
jgi:lysozyme family protein